MPTSATRTGQQGKSDESVPVREPPLPKSMPEKAKEPLPQDSAEKVADKLGDVA